MSKHDKRGAAAQKTEQTPVAAPSATKPKNLPRYKVILHNDDVNDVDHVIESLVMITPLNKDEAARVTDEADKTGCSLILIAHRERAELYAEQFQSRKITVSIEPAD